LDCDFQREYDARAKLTVCAIATKHMLKKLHRTQHYLVGAKTGTLHVHAPADKIEISAGAPPF
jgi:hypothetical protein